MNIEKFVKEVNGLKADEALYLVGNGAMIVDANGGGAFNYRDGDGVPEPLPCVYGPLSQDELLNWLREQGR